MKTIFVVFILCIKNLNAVNIKCNVQENVWTPFGTFEECLAYNVISKEPGQELQTVESYKDLAELYSFYIYESPQCYFLPTGIDVKFPNLKTLIVAHTGLVSITKDDLAPFPELLGLYIDFSKITSIEGDLFINNKNLNQLSLMHNKITYVEEDSFKFLTKLTTFDFKGNPCFSGKGDGRENVEEFFIKIEKNCNVRDNIKVEIESSTQVQNELNLDSNEIEEEED